MPLLLGGIDFKEFIIFFNEIVQLIEISED